MQRAILLLALVACANAQLFQQNYDFRSDLRYVGNPAIPFSGRLEIIPPPELNHAIRLTNSYTQTIRPARGQVVAVDPRFGALGQNPVGSNDLPLLIIAAVGENSDYHEGDVVLVNPFSNGACYGRGVAMILNSPVPHSHATTRVTQDNFNAVPGARTCLISEFSVIAKLNFRASRSEAAPLGLDNFRFVRSDRTIFGPTVF